MTDRYEAAAANGITLCLMRDGRLLCGRSPIWWAHTRYASRVTCKDCLGGK